MSDRFSSKQVVSMVVAVCVAVVLAPTTVWAAATASSVRITYAGRSAHVDGSGRLTVTLGHSALTVKGPVAVKGRVSTIEPQSTIARSGNFTNAGITMLTAATKASLAITEMQVGETRLNGTTNGSDMFIEIQQVSASGTTCSATVIRTLFVSVLGSGQSIDLAPTTPMLVTPSGSTPYCLVLGSSIDTGGTDATSHFPQFRFTAYVASGSYSGIGTAAKPAKLPTSDRKPTSH